ncbi:hypothetical protein QWZ16_20470 [Vibrio ostreicida]|uniref:Uncharacterized protein n=1 Tax=Vibrio ostreicida TaxID=526588 RepID=A0ABT8BXT8_9VIBR|nr:hypothetical protein [Vibrio ostreicida]MDN3611970.1 hypothetical protein [Vibrio ostreicida]
MINRLTVLNLAIRLKFPYQAYWVTLSNGTRFSTISVQKHLELHDQ